MNLDSLSPCGCKWDDQLPLLLPWINNGQCGIDWWYDHSASTGRQKHIGNLFTACEVLVFVLADELVDKPGAVELVIVLHLIGIQRDRPGVTAFFGHGCAVI